MSIINQAAETKYEAVGMDLGRAMQVAELIGHGSVIWHKGHCYPGSGVVLRPVGCMCDHCATSTTGEKHG